MIDPGRFLGPYLQPMVPPIADVGMNMLGLRQRNLEMKQQQPLIQAQVAAAQRLEQERRMAMEEANRKQAEWNAWVGSPGFQQYANLFPQPMNPELLSKMIYFGLPQPKEKEPRVNIPGYGEMSEQYGHYYLPKEKEPKEETEAEKWAKYKRWEFEKLPPEQRSKAMFPGTVSKEDQEAEKNRDQLRANFVQAYQSAQNAYRGADVMTERFEPQQTQVAINHLKRARQLAEQYEALGGNSGDLGISKEQLDAEIADIEIPKKYKGAQKDPAGNWFVIQDGKKYWVRPK